jgi:hypothetical protein
MAASFPILFIRSKMQCDGASTNDLDECTQCEPRGTVSATCTAQTATPPDAAQLHFNVQVKLTVELACPSSVTCNISEATHFQQSLIYEDYTRQSNIRRIVFVLTGSCYWLLRSVASRSNLQLGNADFTSVALQLCVATG